MNKVIKIVTFIICNLGLVGTLTAWVAGLDIPDFIMPLLGIVYVVLGAIVCIERYCETKEKYYEIEEKGYIYKGYGKNETK